MRKPRLGPATPAPNLNEEGRKLKELDELQEALREQIKAFAREIKSVAVPASRSKADNDRIQGILFAMGDLAVKLNKISLSEGAQVTATTAINVTYRLNDKINEVLLQNAALHERLKKLEEANALREKDIQGDSAGKAAPTGV